jgi:hypothetical protein
MCVPDASRTVLVQRKKEKEKIKTRKKEGKKENET